MLLRLELPIDHFRLLGVSPSADAEAVLRALQLRLDRPPEQGFTKEVLNQRAELLRLSSDLLLDEEQRHEYEIALLDGASGLELSPNREVAGLILLMESKVSSEAFLLSKKALQPPQAPALGSGREADLTLVAGISCLDAAKQEQEGRHYESAATFLQEGIHLLQRIGKLQEQREILETELEELLPYRILDLLSRDLGDEKSHQLGLELLDQFVRDRGGLEGKDSAASSSIAGFKQVDFEVFFQQIRKFLTVQEQIDLFVTWYKQGSADAGFLASISLVASGFSQRKPEKLLEAKKYLNNLDLPLLDLNPLFGCIYLLLADITQAEAKFKHSSDSALVNWLNDYPGESLAAFCDYCRDWLRSDVLPGYRDVDSESVDLEAWFADRDVQMFIENKENKRGFSIPGNGFSFLNSLSNDNIRGQKEGPSIDNNHLDEQELFNEVSSDPDSSLEDDFQEVYPVTLFRKSITLFSRIFSFNHASGRLKSLPKAKLIKFTSLILLVLTPILILSNRKQINRPALDQEQEKSKITLLEIDKENNFFPAEVGKEIKKVTSENPTKEEITNLIEAWLQGKSQILSGAENNFLSKVARPNLVKRVNEERLEDLSKDQLQIINATLISLNIVDQTPKRIQVKALLKYKDQRLNSNGQILSETVIPSLSVTYIFGREKTQWQLVAYLSGK